VRVGKLIKTIVILIAIFVVVTLVISYHNFRKSLPKAKGTIELSGLREPVEIYRDSYGIPHIFAQNDDDLYFAAGYVTAQDRIWQLELTRRIVNGQVSAIFGDTTLAVDRLLLTLGFKRIGQKLSFFISDQSRRILTAYVKGINTYIRQNKGKYPIEFLVLNCEPELWRVEDCLAFSRLTAWQLSFAWHTELLAANLLTKIGTEKTRELFCKYSPRWPVIIPSEIAKLSNLLTPLRESEKLLSSFLGIHALSVGSNGWVIAPGKSESGYASLANDPHLPLTNPSCWYVMHLVTPKLNVAGFTFPGNPGIVIGFNDHIAWGVTNAMADDADFYIETINSNNPNQYWYNGHWENFQTITDTIVIKNKPPRPIIIRLTKHGPVVSDIHPQLSLKTSLMGSKKDSPVVVTLRWTGQELSDEGLAIYLLNRARNWQDFQKAIRYFKVPVENILYADRRGNIGYWCAGTIPVRGEKFGFLPMKTGPDQKDPGWLGSIPFEDLPHLYNPSTGFIATANNKIVPDSYPYYISILWEPPSRIERIEEILNSKKRLSEENLKSLQTDLLSPFVRKIMQFTLPIIREDVQHRENFRAIYPYLKGWDFSMHGESAAAAIFEVFLNHLLSNTFQDELGKKLYREYLYFPGLPIRALWYLIEERKWHWFDDVSTPDRVETPSEIVKRSLSEALTELEEKLGKNMAKWRWDKLHTVMFRHFLGTETMPGKLLNIGPLPMPGSYTTVFNGGYDFNRPYSCIVGPSMRMIHDFAHPGQTSIINPPGQVAHPLSANFKDQVDFWLNGLYINLISDTSRVRRALKEEKGWKRLLLLNKPQNSR